PTHAHQNNVLRKMGPLEAHRHCRSPSLFIIESQAGGSYPKSPQMKICDRTLFGTTITYKAFYNQVAKPHLADFARTMTERLISEMTLKVLGFEKGRAFSEFRHIVIQDGSSFAIHDSLREVFPGRFKTVKPAAVELHTTMDLLCDAPTTVVLTPDTTNEQTFLPEPASLRDSVLLADRGYVDLHYLARGPDGGGFFLILAK